MGLFMFRSNNVACTLSWKRLLHMLSLIKFIFPFVLLATL
jgi:hypothetical protein